MLNKSTAKYPNLHLPTYKGLASYEQLVSKNLGDPLLANPDLAEIEDLFIADYKAADGPNDRAIFMRHESEGRLHCDVVVYLSPPLYALAAELDAQPCRPPVINGLSLLVGPERAWPLLFPEFIP